ncbi:DUF3168 domain-containing protein [Elioraea sp.]|uniref:tail completion protein gp17 n=1 Tax=Elioraea sp. TaxID=2185103 RepID=UPI0025B8BF80|nr:DUF3168 domain-containing protein [Elioraea sp.]
MTLEQRLHTLLAMTPSVSALVAARIHPVVAPASCPTPYIVYTRVNAQRIAALDAPTGWARVRMQIACWADDATAARAAANAVRALLDGYATADIPHVKVEAETEVFDRDVELTGRAVDVVIMIKE